MPRLQNYLDNDRWLGKILTVNELEQYKSLNNERRRLEYLCGRFASKEAYAKASGQGIGMVDFLDFEVLRQDNGQPLSNNGQVSISHDGDYAIAMVMLDV